MSLLAFAHACEASAIGAYGRRSSLFFPSVEVVHLLGLALLLGSVLAIDLRLLGLAMRRQSVATIVRATTPLLGVGLSLAVASGALLFMTEAVKCYYNAAFWFKLGFLVLAVLTQIALSWRARAIVRPAAVLRGWAALSLLFWFGVAAAGRAIAFI
jgi:hypothetical protein